MYLVFEQNDFYERGVDKALKIRLLYYNDNIQTERIKTPREEQQIDK